MIYPEPGENVQSSEERSEAESAGPIEDSGAADSSDEVAVAPPATSTARSDITETVSCSDTTDTTTSSPENTSDNAANSQDNPSSEESSNNTSPDQSLQ